MYRFLIAGLIGWSSIVANAQLYINEFMAANSSVITDPDFNESADWIEFYNASPFAVNLGAYFLTDNLSDTVKWTIPNNTLIQGNDFIVFWADGADTGLHTIFKLLSDGEEIGLYNPELELVDGITYSLQQTDVSYGRQTDADPNWKWFLQPSPGESNNNSTPYDGITYYQPNFTQQGGFYSSPLSLQLSSFAGTIHYTEDGRIPTENDLIYASPILVDTTKFIRARVFEVGKIPGPVITNSYFFDETLTERALPVVSLVSDPANFWDPEIGLYVQDFKPEWEHPLNIEFFENDGNNQAVFNLQAGVKINGLYSWQLPQKMLGIYFRNQYGTGNLDYPIFHDRERYSYDEFILRASGSDWSFTLFRDGLCQSLTQENGPVFKQGFRQCIVFINGEYMGIHNMRSRSNAETIVSAYGLPKGSFDIIANDGEVEEGSDLQYQYMNALFNTDLSILQNFDLLAEVVDLENFTDYWISEMWCSNSSWGHNVLLWKPHDDGKWQFIFGDLDRGFTGSTNDPINGFSIPQGNNYDYARLWLQHIFQNENYANYFAQRFADHIYTTYHPLRVNKFVDQFQNPLIPEIDYHVERYLGTTSPYGDAMPNVEFWEQQVEALKTFALSRQSFMMADLQSTFDLNAIVSIGTASLPNNGGTIKINEFKIPGSPWNGPYFSEMPLNLIAKPNPGYVFEGWSNYGSQPLFNLEETWNYLDDGSYPGDNWKNTDFDDAIWDSGNAEFGYGDGDENTTVSYGPDPGNKYITTYFRKTFEFTGDADLPQSCVLNVRRDDGMVVYLNGNEIVRNNLPQGYIDTQTLALEAIAGADEVNLNQYLLEVALINGNNVIAVEIHQSNGSSSDISFDASFSILSPSEEVISMSDTLSINLNQNAGFIARYIPSGECILPSEIEENTVLTIDCSPYLASGDTYVLPNVSLSIEPGVEIHFPAEARLIVQGDLQVNGSDVLPVIFKANTAYGAESWGNISFENCTGINNLHHFRIEDATKGEHLVHNRAAISGWFSELNIDNADLTDNFHNPIFTEYSDVSLTNSELYSAVTGDLINVKYGQAYISDCEFQGNNQIDTDAIDYDKVTNGIIRNSKIEGFYGFNSDGIDIGEACENIIIENCFINDITDKGISIGQGSTVSISNSRIVNCNLAVGIKDMAFVNIDHVSTYSNVYGISCFEKNPGFGGGFANITNTILSNSSSAPIYADEYSDISANYCIYDTGEMTGGNVIEDNPEYIDPGHYNFQLTFTSPANAAGNDGLNIGALYHEFDADPKIVISEIMYMDVLNPEREFITIWNFGESVIEISNYTISEAVDFVFPEGTFILPDEKIYITEDWAQVTDLSGQIFDWESGKLGNSGETILLSDDHGIIIDYVPYSTELEWPIVSESGQYIELIANSLDNHFGSSWKLMPDPDTIIENQNSAISMYPNPASTVVFLNSDKPISEVRVFDMTGRLVHQQLGNSNQMSLHVNQLNRGVYTLLINNQNHQKLSIER